MTCFRKQPHRHVAATRFPVRGPGGVGPVHARPKPLPANPAHLRQGEKQSIAIFLLRMLSTFDSLNHRQAALVNIIGIQEIGVLAFINCIHITIQTQEWFPLSIATTKPRELPNILERLSPKSSNSTKCAPVSVFRLPSKRTIVSGGPKAPEIRWWAWQISTAALALTILPMYIVPLCKNFVPRNLNKSKPYISCRLTRETSEY